MHTLTERFIDMYQQLGKDNLSVLKQVYHPQVHFTDPLHALQGLDKLEDYFAAMYANVSSIEFQILDTFDVNDNAFVYWDMRFTHKHLNQGKDVWVKGHSHLRFSDNKVIYHHDYFDAAAMLYRHIPVLKHMIKLIDKRVANS
ncbi:MULTISPECIES: nuclear transport factor 2 family protein [Pseudoalteromonas]|uniref:Transcriptional regulator n=1 Tax=Pseudoalteromonas amylolytica TaxID=1859457 RepID=A0A1S1MW04_9GAMM|nr:MULTISPECIES: nuclear transport factor 2 family protein [Pseudoalteromonas]MCF6434379.1 nuclear transport factor 2 family protein [Pseudoalteromonas sp. MMG022]OHU85417.1 transcriptional regulator [Pseudoalteromonas sp. JW3]OHU92962.1 transcriptional regulator [Pseudoalteromonas amylolytica]